MKGTLNNATASAQSSLSERSETFLVQFDDGNSVLGSRAYDLRGSIPRRYWRDIVHAFTLICRDKSEDRRKEYYYSLLRLREFARSTSLHRYELFDCREFLAWLETIKRLDRGPRKRNQILREYNPLIRILRYLKHILRLPWCQNIAIRSAPYSRNRRIHQIPARLSDVQLLAIYTWACKEIEQCRVATPKEVNSRQLFPYILAILCLTAANPNAVRLLTRDSLLPLAGRQKREMLVWTKHRAIREQRLSYSTEKDFQPPMLIREVERLTGSLRLSALPGQQDYLFLCRRARENGAFTAVISATIMRSELKSFIVRYQLPHFTMVTLRRSDAQYLYMATDGDHGAVQAFLNHDDQETSKVYLQSVAVAEFDERIIAQTQEAMIAHWLPQNPTMDSVRLRLNVNEEIARKILMGKNATLSGITCKNPLEGIAPGQKVGQLCTHFLGCFSCSNAIITTDSLTFARLKTWNDHLLKARKDMSLERWEHLYLPIVTILERDVFPYFPDAIQREGINIIGSLPDLPEMSSR